MTDEPDGGGTAVFAQLYREARPLLFAIAYRMTGSVGEAEDIAQEAFLRYHRAVGDGVTVESPKAFLTTVTTRLCLDHLRSAHTRRERHVGSWLPEPLITDGGAGDPASYAEQAETLSMAFLALLERLSPVERAVFVLRDVFGYGFDEIADAVGKSEANCRQLAVRARRHVAEGRPRFEPSRAEREQLAARFFAAVGEGDLDGLVRLLADGVVVYGDGAAGRPSWPRPIVGRDKVARLLHGLGQQLRQLGVRLDRAEVNGQPGAVFRDADGGVVNVFCLDIADGQIQTVRSVINPEKLRHLGPAADVSALLQRRGPRAGPAAGSTMPE